MLPVHQTAKKKKTEMVTTRIITIVFSVSRKWFFLSKEEQNPTFLGIPTEIRAAILEKIN